VVPKILGSIVEGVCLLLMVVLSVDLMLGVFSRYVLARTFTWYDEIARAAFVWVVFLGAAVGVKRGAHFRLHLLVDVLPRPLQRGAQGLGVLVAIGFSVVLIQHGWAFMELGRVQTLPVSGVSKAWVYAAMPVGGVLIIVYTLPRLWRVLAGRG
jgi:TRAP-type C4-dicarboxylate transport system permease small subunit